MPQNSIHVLFVDDEPWTVREHRAELTDRGHQVEFKSDADDAYKKLRQDKDDAFSEYHAIILDIKMEPPVSKHNRAQMAKLGCDAEDVGAYLYSTFREWNTVTPVILFSQLMAIEIESSLRKLARHFKLWPNDVVSSEDTDTFAHWLEQNQRTLLELKNGKCANVQRFADLVESVVERWPT